MPINWILGHKPQHILHTKLNPLFSLLPYRVNTVPNYLTSGLAEFISQFTSRSSEYNSWLPNL